MLPEVVEQVPHVGSWSRQDRQALTGADLGDDQERTFIFQYRGTEHTCVGTEPQPGRVLHHGSGEGGQRVDVDRIARCLFDGQSIGAQHHYRLYPGATCKVPDYVRKTGHGILCVDQTQQSGRRPPHLARSGPRHVGRRGRQMYVIAEREISVLTRILPEPSIPSCLQKIGFF
jgi:hypothetical protein